MSTEYHNPIIPGFAPDPSIAFVNGTFFLVNSSFHVFPGLPIYASEDLISWRQIGNAFNRANQLSLKNATTGRHVLDTGAIMLATGGLFAPTIRHHNDVFYIICTNADNKGEMNLQNFYITTTDIYSNEWSDPINFDWFGIDPSIFFDDDNRAYVQGCWVLSRTQQPTCTLKQMEIDIKTGKPLSEPAVIWDGFAKYDSEGPHIYKKDGYYYLLAAEGGTFEHHLLSIARSKSIWGPFESYENNPILTADGKDEYIQNTGHGELFEDGNGQWWAAVLAVRRKDWEHYPMGRETFLTPVHWPTGGWPQIRQPKMNFTHSSAATATTTKCVSTNTKVQERMSDLYIRSPARDAYKFSADGKITIKPSEKNLTDATGEVNFVGKRQRALESVASVTMHIDAQNSGRLIDSGLSIYKDSMRHSEIFYDHSTAEISLHRHNEVTGDFNLKEKLSEGVLSLELSIHTTEMVYEFMYRIQENAEWILLGSVDTSEMTVRDMTGPIFGVFAVGKDFEKASAVTFSGFKITPNWDT